MMGMLHLAENWVRDALKVLLHRRVHCGRWCPAVTSCRRLVSASGVIPAIWLHLLFAVLGMEIVAPTHASVLPEDRADILYHRYEGGGVTIDGPSILVRKSVGKNVSLAANYYVDMVSSASIDVITTASPYTEERTQYSMGMDYLHGNTTMRVNYTTSEESDFDAETVSFSVSQDMF